MAKAPQKRTNEFKLMVALESLKGERAITDLAALHNLHPKQIRRWRDKLLSEGAEIFTHKATQKITEPNREHLLHLIGQLSLELEYLKKKLNNNP